MRNLALAFRTLFKSPFVTVVAVLSVALGIGANAAVFSLFDEILMQPLPVNDPGRLVNFRVLGPQTGFSTCGRAGNCDEIVSYPMYKDLERSNTALAGIAGHELFDVNVAMAGQMPVNGEGVLVSGSYFPLLGLRPALGRLIGPADDRATGGEPVAVLSYGYWTTDLGGNPNVIGQSISVNGHQLTVVGVAPRGFEGTTLGARPYVFVPITMEETVSGATSLTDRRDHWVYVFGRIRRGATLAQATASINVAYSRLINEVEAPLQRGLSDTKMAQFRAQKLELSDGSRGQSELHRQTKTPLFLLLAVTTIVLLIACANIANLQLARAVNRQMEMAVRLSLGATRQQLVSQLLIESVLLATIGGVVSIYLAYLTLNGIGAMLPSALGVTYSLHANAIAFAAGLSLTTGLLFGLAPAIQSTRPDLVTELRNNSGTLAGGRGAARFRTTLVTAQIALSMALLVVAGLFIQSLRNVSRIDLGIDVDNMAMFAISPSLNGYDSTRIANVYERVEQALSASPGITGVTSSSVQFLSGHNRSRNIDVEGFHRDPDTDASAHYAPVGANYLEVTGVPRLAGRDFTARDDAGRQKVAIVNQTFAKKFHLGDNPVGKHISTGNGSPVDIEIVGLAKDAKYSEVKQVVPPTFFVPYRQFGVSGTLYFYVRARLPSAQVLASIRAVMQRVDRGLPIDDMKTMPQQVRENVYLDRMISAMSAAFAVLATLLAAVGLYGVLAYSVGQRTREIGVRMALGADAGNVRGMVLGQVGRMSIIGGTIGFAGAFALGRAARSMLYQLDATDPFIFALAGAVLGVVVLAAGLLPALRASRVDPMQALRHE
jgi:predicted permease